MIYDACTALRAQEQEKRVDGERGESRLIRKIGFNLGQECKKRADKVLKVLKADGVGEGQHQEDRG